ncbi:MAG: hypothetical protein FWD61_05830 [Phycisphaerales bacterium]|nr:hypothetical protein [Phycisphaerales bacterium]
MPETPSAEFIDNGRRLIVRNPKLVDQGDARLFNDTMEVLINLRGKTDARFVQPNNSTYSEKLRAFYLRDDQTGELWSVPFEPVQKDPDTYECSIGPGDIQWRTTTHDIEVHLRLVVPRDDQVELWTVRVTNKSNRDRKVSLYSYFPIGIITWITQRAQFEPDLNAMIFSFFPYYVKVADYFRLKQRKPLVFLAADREPTSFEANRREFLGGKAEHNPAALSQPTLAGGDSHFEEVANTLQYQMPLATDQSETFNFAFGPARDRKEIARLKKTYLHPNGIDKALEKVEAYLDAIQPTVQIQTPDKDLDAYINTWLPQQAHFCGGLQRMSGDPCVRNLFQDAMGITWTQPAKARHWYTTVFAQQHKDGFMPHGCPLAPGVDTALINTIPHRDMNVWSPLALAFYINETGDTDILKEKIPYKDSPKKSSLYEHINLGLDYQLKDRTWRRLCRIGEGDWDDPLNMAGYKNKGESIWLTEALAIALDTWAPFAELMGDKKIANLYRREAEVCRKAINALAWDGQWYARGTTDAGKWFGTKKDKEGKIFLNAQSWALICGAANDPKRIAQCIASVNKHLMTPSGPMTMFPGYTAMREDIGKITQKTPGSSENGSVYCHAATFYAYSLFVVRNPDEGFRVLRMLLTGAAQGLSNTLARSQQLPNIIPNYYNGLQAGRTAGRTSGEYNTGTVAWYYRTAINELLGLKGELNGLRIDPQLPSTWPQASAWRKFRDAEFNITITRTPNISQPQILFNGQPLKDNLIPLQQPGSKHSVEVRIP